MPAPNFGDGRAIAGGYAAAVILAIGLCGFFINTWVGGTTTALAVVGVVWVFRRMKTW